MPELPEVETTLQGIKPYLHDLQINSGYSQISNIVVRNGSLRWPVPVAQLQALIGQDIIASSRRAKYILLETPKGTILLHLGMSGSLRVLDKASAESSIGKHDHIDVELNKQTVIRYNDPRRFGCCLFIDGDASKHKLLKSLGPEPLSDEFNGDYLFKQSRGRSVAVKNFIMDGKIVVGVGNIYASESLFMSGIRPTSKACKLSRKRYQQLAIVIKQVLSKAIQAGGTTLKDFSQSDGKPGYFAQELQVYGRAGQPCLVCQTSIKSQVIGQRNTFHCSQCQKP